MTPINEVPVGKFVRFAGNVCYICMNNFKDSYVVAPLLGGFVPQDKPFDYKVYVYKRIPREWIEPAKKWVEFTHTEQRIDNLTYIENLDILNNLTKDDIVSNEK